MCEMRVAVLKENLGSRDICWSLWNGKEVMEMTSKQIVNTIKAGNKVCGLTIGSNGELELDREGFFATNMMVHRHCGNYKPMLEEGCMANMFYVVIGSHEENGNVVYDCISTKWEQAKLSEADLRAYLKIGIVSAGATIIDNKVVLADLEFKKEVADKVEAVPVEKEEDAKTEKAELPVDTKTTEQKEVKPVEVKPVTPEKEKGFFSKK